MVHDAADAAESDAGIMPACPGVLETPISLLSEERRIYSLFPHTGEVKLVGDLVCPESAAKPHSMAVKSDGTGHVGFTSGELFRVNLANAHCESTPFVPGQMGWTKMGMGYAALAGIGETLFVTRHEDSGAPSGLARVETTSYELIPIAPFSPPMSSCELTGTPDDALFAYCMHVTGGSVLARIEATTGYVLQSHELSVEGKDFHFAFWDGAFYLFTGSGQAMVSRFDPIDGSLATLYYLDFSVIGAGVARCPSPDAGW